MLPLSTFRNVPTQAVRKVLSATVLLCALRGVVHSFGERGIIHRSACGGLQRQGQERGGVCGLGGLRCGRLRLLWGRGWFLELWVFSVGHSALRTAPMWMHTGSDGGVRWGGGGDRGVPRGRSVVRWALLRSLSVLVLFEADVPGQATHGGNRFELVDDVPRDEVDVVVAELHPDVPDALSPQLVQLGVVHPLNTL